MKEADMLNRFFEVVRRANFGSDFQEYFKDVSRKNGPYSPTVDEAKRDYRSALRARF